MDRPVIAVIGSFVMGISVRLPRPPHPGETLVADLFDLGPGGKGNNAAIAATRLGAEVILIERIGDDIFSQTAINLNLSENIDTRHILVSKGSQTGVGLVYLQPDGENTIGLYKGANELLSPEDIRNAKDDIIRSKVMLAQLEVPDAALIEAFTIAKEHEITVILNPAPARLLSDEILSKVDIITPNSTEIFTMFELEIPSDYSIEVIEDLANKLLEKGPSVVVITMGSKGALLVRKDCESVFQPSFPVHAIDAVGAGDSFNAGLVVAIAMGKTMDEALYLASVNGALATTQMGAISALPTAKQVEAFLKERG